MKDTSNTIAVVGAGMAGLTCANELAKAGFAPVLFDKGRGPGGRMAARRAEVAGETVS
ncbi:MAG: FAD-dependent oxidoreductase, partial [Marinomonas sp.]